MKKFGILFLTVLLICSLVACKSKNPAQQPPATTQPVTVPAENHFLRLQSVTIEKELESETVTETVDVVWTDNGCEFTLNGKPLRAALDPETNVLTFYGEDDRTMPVFGYDENGVINQKYMKMGDEYICVSVTYDEQGYPITKPNILNKEGYDEQKKTINWPSTSTSCEVLHLGENGIISYVEETQIERVDGKEISRETVESSTCFVYDEHGNLLSLQLGYIKFTFNYSQDITRHNWERIVPLVFADAERTWYQYLPLYWNVK